MLDRTYLESRKFHFTSLGCARNLVDSEVMIGILLKAGYEIEPRIEESDYLVVNTCGFLEAAREEAIETIETLLEEKKPSAKLIVAGCMVQKHKELLKEKFPEIHAFLGSGDVEKILEAVQSKLPLEHVSNAKSYLEWGEVPRKVVTPSHYAYLKIAEGCKKRCSFCVIPTIKGPLKSKTEDQVLKEFEALLAQGIFEVILIAQDLGDFGKDRMEKKGLVSLLKRMLGVKKDFWLRLLYLYPDEIDEEIISLIKSDPRICPYLDMPIQHINNRLLKAMHRKTSKEDILNTLQSLRREIPEIVIRTSLMVGFPGETEEEFEELVDFVKEGYLDHVGIFAFSKEKEAYASKLEGQIPEKIKEQRRLKLAKVQLSSWKKRAKRWVGQTVKAVVEGFHPETDLLVVARFQGQCPDVDGVILLNDIEKIERFGTFYEVKITGVCGYDLQGEIIQPVVLKKPTSKLVLV